jgi:Uri superfamily endonuclease
MVKREHTNQSVKTNHWHANYLTCNANNHRVVNKEAPQTSKETDAHL